jgi:hypothetical protein
MIIIRVTGAVLNAQPPADVVRSLFTLFKKECNNQLYVDFKDSLDEIVQAVAARTRIETIKNMTCLDESTKKFICERVKIEQATHHWTNTGNGLASPNNLGLSDVAALPDMQYLCQETVDTKKRAGKKEELSDYRGSYTSTKYHL